MGEAERLSSLVHNLLTITRLESPTIELRRTAEDIEDIVDSAVMRLSPALANRPLNVEVPSIFLWRREPKSLELVALNLLENALRYTPKGSPIDISAKGNNGFLVVRSPIGGRVSPKASRSACSRIFD